MAKGNGTTRQGNSFSPNGLMTNNMSSFSQKEYEKQIAEDRKSFYGYGPEWERTFFDEVSGGYLVTQLSRKFKEMSNNEERTFKKEQEMGMRFASFGFQIEHLEEVPGVSSPDAAIKRIGTSIRVNGKTADFKRMSSANNIYAEGKDARFKKKASLVMYEFTSHFDGIKRALDRLAEKGIHGYYYFSDENTYHSF